MWSIHKIPRELTGGLKVGLVKGVGGRGWEWAERGTASSQPWEARGKG